MEPALCRVLINKFPFIAEIRNSNSNVFLPWRDALPRLSYPGVPIRSSERPREIEKLPENTRKMSTRGLNNGRNWQPSAIAARPNPRLDLRNGHGRCEVIPCYEGALLRIYNIKTGTNTVGTPLRYETRIRSHAQYLVAVVASVRGRLLIHRKGIGV
jgi:hypothetical protein